MYRSLNQLQWKLERDNFHRHVSMTCLVVLITQFKEFFDSKEVNASDVQNKCWQKNFIDGTKWEPKNYRRLLLWYLEELDKLIDERVLKYVELRIKEKEVQAIKETEKRLKESDLHQQESLITEGSAVEACLVTKGAVLEACLVNEGIILNDNTSVTKSSGTESENISAQQPHATFPQLDSRLAVLTSLPTIDLIACLHKEMVLDVSSSSGNENRSSNYKGNRLVNDADVKKMLVDMSYPDIENDDIGTSYDSDTVSKGLGFENQNDNANPSVLNKAKELAPCLSNIEEMGKDERSYHKIISKEELKCEAEKRLKVKQRKSPLSYHGFVYAETQFEEPLKVPLKRRNVNLKEHLEQVQLINYDLKLWNNLLMKYFCYVKQAMLKFKKQKFLEINCRKSLNL
nr:hypothetical protein [Tanacetum cinerariifolium]